ncbi:isochorismatase family protein [Thermodesulfobacterium hydrogeniphilum]|uniref:isochorismatase family protein n=1 Tax=Thermodesulfobacterium hydrogeniphilum TaxID=161156 RepID=UPI000570C85C|nr:isochorismatase family protein [Thermodesulfobacterium hydrogeniphilum]
MEPFKYFLKPEEVILVIIDIQEKLVKAMPEDIAKIVIQNNIILIELCKIYNIPILLTEQYPKGLGQTVEEIKRVLPEYEPIEKITFNSCLEPKFMEKLEKNNRKKVILTGIETHICVYQTALDLLNKDYIVYLPKDAVCSRKKQNWETGLMLVSLAGGVVADTETLIFQVLERAGTEEFKKMVKYIK